ncbi:MAG: glutamate 5-kinase [Clostridia bacterium]|jgi:glutamate 5-kinase
MEDIRKGLHKSKRIVIKVGTSTITYGTGMINFTAIEKLVRVISDLQNQGKEVVLVTSGAISVGVDKLKFCDEPMTIPEKQAIAAVGQCELMYIYSKFFSEYNHIVGQILLTRDVVEQVKRRQNVINTFENLIIKGIIPIVNENDSVSVEEIKIGDNDTLSAIVARLIDADLLIVLSDIEGFYDSDPRKKEDAKIIPVIDEITPEIEKCAGEKGTKRATGGMKTKLAAAKIVTDANINMIIASGKNPGIISDIINGKNIGTLFVAKKEA